MGCLDVFPRIPRVAYSLHPPHVSQFVTTQVDHSRVGEFDADLSVALGSGGLSSLEECSPSTASLSPRRLCSSVSNPSHSFRPHLDGATPEQSRVCGWSVAWDRPEAEPGWARVLSALRSRLGRFTPLPEPLDSFTQADNQLIPFLQPVVNLHPLCLIHSSLPPPPAPTYGNDPRNPHKATTTPAH